MIRALLIPFTFLQALRLILRSRELITLCLLPAVIGFTTFLLLAATLFLWRERCFELVFALMDWDSQSRFVLSLGGVVVFFLGLIPSAIGAYLTMMVVGGFFIEELILRFTRQLHGERVSSEPKRSVVASILRGIRDDGLRVVFLLFVLLLAFIAGIFPPLYVLPLGISFLLVGFDMFDTPLALQGVAFPERLALYRKHPLELLALGALLSSSVLIPPLFFIAIPAGHIAAVLRLREWRSDS